MGKPPASAITFVAPDGLRVVYAHIQDVRVSVGDEVKPGDVVALIGNNGMCRNPHVHVGAWRDEQPLQVRFDLGALGARRRAAKGEG
jgi:murein DD-endopeptidase MepM/ murein hydrolase activator NlpD